MTGTSDIDGVRELSQSRQQGTWLSSVLDVCLPAAGPDLPEELQVELEKFQEHFTVGSEKLKQISKRFQEELEEGKCCQAAHISRLKNRRSSSVQTAWHHAQSGELEAR